MAIEKVKPVTAPKVPAPNAGIEPAPASQVAPVSETPKKDGRRGPRGPRGETLTWDSDRIKALRRTARKIVNSGKSLTPMALTSAVSELPEFAGQKHLLESTGGVTRVVTKYTSILAAIEKARQEGREFPAMPALAGVGSLRGESMLEALQDDDDEE